MPDPRGEQPRKLRKLIEIVVIAVCAVLARSDSWEELADYGVMKEGFLRRCLALPSGIPPHDTCNRVLSQLDPLAWRTCYMSWMRAIGHLSEEKLMSIDGKGLRGSKAKGGGKRDEAGCFGNGECLGK